MARTRPYAGLSDPELTLRDILARDRTVLANERTLLAYLRTALGLLGGGVAMLHFLVGPRTALVGWTLVGLSVPVVVVGVWRFVRMRRMLGPTPGTPVTPVTPVTPD